MRALGWFFAVLGVFGLFAWFFGYLVLTQVVQLPDVPGWFHAVGGLSALLVAAWLFLDWGSLSTLGNDQTVGRSFTAGLLLLVGMCIAIAANVVGHRYDKKWDFTASKQFSLADQSLQTARGLDRAVDMVVFFPAGTAEESNFKELVEGYTDESTFISVSYHDPFTDIMAVTKEGITSQYGTVIVRAGATEERITSGFGEEELTNALIKVTSDTTHTVCAVTGHGEADVNDNSGPEGMGVVFGKLAKQNYTIRAVELLKEQPTPETCEAVVLPGPRTDLLPSELDRLAEYVTAGGRLVVMLEPTLTPQTAADMSRYGVVVGDDIVLAPMRQLMDMGSTSIGLVGDSFEPHAITDKLKGLVGLPAARSVAAGPAIDGISVFELMNAGDGSWAEVNSLRDPTIPAQADAEERAENVPLAVAVEINEPAAVSVRRASLPITPVIDGAPVLVPAEPPPELADKAGGRVVILGSATFATNVLATYGLNGDLALNALGWSRGDEKAITIRADEGKKGKITVDIVGATVAGLLSFFLVPGLAVLGAVGTWMRRRQS
ncbi:MAG: hypothetical protein EXR71_09200 [Myxococcales bacterium]|nr:hypothetical protein [Myxococcales bacterium]